MKSNASLFYSLVLVVGDFLALVAAFGAAFILRGPLSAAPVPNPIPAITYLQIFLLLLPFWILIFALLGLYTNTIHEKRFAELGRLLVGSFIGLLFVTAYAYIENRPIFPAKMVPVYGFALGFIFLIIFRNIARAARAKLFNYGIGITNILIVGNTKITDELIGILADSRVSGYRIVGIVGEKSFTKYGQLPTFGSFDEAITRLKTPDIHGIVQTELFAAASRNNEVLEFAQTHHISYRFVPGNSELFVGNIEVELFRSSIPVIAVHQTAIIGWGRVVKRVADAALGAAALAVALPFMLLIALAQKILNPKSPILYKETRLTRFGHPIRIYKFRTMKLTYSGMTPEEAFRKMDRPELIDKYRKNGDYIPNDPRITRLGRLLRATSLDELPQLFNVLKGDISFVGPRALQPHELEKFAKKDLILAVKSGLTGLAQVSGRRDISFEERRKLDLFYVQNWS
jgi:exopolysaccharide biosynthesis polyprenyl glycosylphosphotransferase